MLVRRAGFGRKLLVNTTRYLPNLPLQILKLEHETALMWLRRSRFEDDFDAVIFFVIEDVISLGCLC
jgi:hypothetical protein